MTTNLAHASHSNDEPTLSAEEGAQLAGVSLDTIEKYVSIGLLSPIASDEGQSRYLESDIRSLFYTRQNKASSDHADAELPPSSLELAQEESPEQESSAGNDSQDGEVLQAGAEPLPGNPGTDASQEHETLENVSNSHPDEASPLTTTAGSERAEGEPASPHLADVVEREVQFSHGEQTTTAYSIHSSADSHRQLHTEDESVQGTVKSSEAAVKDYIELNKALREQIVSLKDERDWLRNRIEQLELRGEREQMLLLSESETVRRLVTQKSLTERVMQTFRLPWLSSDNNKQK